MSIQAGFYVFVWVMKMRDRILKGIQVIFIVGIVIVIPICIYEGYKLWRAYEEFNNPSVVEDETYFKELPSYGEDESDWPEETLFVEQKRENNVVLKKHPERENYLMMLTPALEKFILTAAKDCGIPDNEIPFTEKRLKQLTKSKDAEKSQ